MKSGPAKALDTESPVPVEWLAAHAFFEEHPDHHKFSRHFGRTPANDKFLAIDCAVKKGKSYPHSFIKVAGKIYALSSNRFVIGEGGVGKVKTCYDENGSKFAVKITNSLTDEMEIEDEVLKKLGRSYGLTKAKYYDPTRRSMKIKSYSVQEFIEGQDLLSLLIYLRKRGITLDQSSRAKIAYDTAKSIAFLHNRGIIHCDVAARNIMVSTQNNGKTITETATPVDFGISKIIPEGQNYVITDLEENAFNLNIITLRNELFETVDGEDRARWTPAFDVFCLHDVFKDLGITTTFDGKDMASIDPTNRPNIEEVINGLLIAYPDMLVMSKDDADSELELDITHVPDEKKDDSFAFEDGPIIMPEYILRLSSGGSFTYTPSKPNDKTKEEDPDSAKGRKNRKSRM